MNNDEYTEKSLLATFIKIPVDLTHQKYITAKQYAKKNNFNNILASEESRVKLTKSTGDYINANYIFDKYIATQQPNDHTIVDFWHMIHQTKSGVIVNLNGENNYLPQTNHQSYGKIVVHIIKFIDNKTLQIRKLELYHINNKSEKHTVYHITFKKWKDFDVPLENDFWRLLTIVNMVEYQETNSPIIIHCKAGVGRTGTFIAIHYYYRQLRLGNYIDPIDIIKEMRKARCGMVQNKKQFSFILNIIKRHIIKKENKSKNPLSMSCGEIYNKTTKIESNLSLSAEISST
jgi:protein tyrosine phosphatase